MRPDKKPRTYEREEALFRLWISPEIGGSPFHDITKGDIENIFYTIVNNGKSVRTAEYAMTTLKQIWREAQEKDYAPKMPVVSKALKTKINNNLKTNARIRYLSHEEANRLLEELKKVSFPVYERTLLSIHCGLRASEIFNLTWGNVKLDGGYLDITDSKGENRTVSMTREVQTLMRSKEKGEPNELVFPGRHGGPSKQISRIFRDICDELFNQGVTDHRQKVVFHTCRHTCASWMVKEGVSLYVVQKVLGHSSITVTERYSHLAPDQLKLAAQAIDKTTGGPLDHIKDAVSKLREIVNGTEFNVIKDALSSLEQSIETAETPNIVQFKKREA